MRIKLDSSKARCFVIGDKTINGRGVSEVEVSEATGARLLASGYFRRVDPALMELLNQMLRGAERLISTQKVDGGWQWQSPDTNPNAGIPTPSNTLGVTAMGLLSTCIKSYSPDWVEAGKRTYQGLLQRSQSSTPSIRKIRGPDIPFLTRLAERTGDATYANFAKVRYQATLTEFGGGTATGLAAYIRDLRKGQGYRSLISWDISLYILGCRALNTRFPGQGFDGHARDMAEVVYNALYVAPVDFDFANQLQNEYWIAFQGAIEAFLQTQVHGDKLDWLQAKLLGSQVGDGHFVGVGDGSSTQTTAYIAFTLANLGLWAQAERAVKFLASKQLASGGWAYDSVTENTEVTSEALRAICHWLHNQHLEVGNG